MTDANLSTNTITQVSQPPESLHPISEGYRNVRNELAVVHPLENSERNYNVRQEELKLDLLRATYGVGIPMKLEFERHLVAKNQRLSPLPNHSISLDVLLGRDNTIDFDDYLHPPEFFEEEPSSRLIGEHLLKSSMKKPLF